MLATIMMRNGYFLAIVILIWSCGENPTINQSSAELNREIEDSPIDSISLQEAINSFDHQNMNENLNPEKKMKEIRIIIDSLKNEYKDNEHNVILKDKISKIESDFKMMEFIEKDIEKRDSILNHLLQTRK